MRSILIILISFILAGCANEYSQNQPIETKDNLVEQHWNNVFTKAFLEVDCPPVRDPNSLPDGYYKGPMIDTHIHLQSLPDGEPGQPDYYGYNLGIKRSIDEWICMMDVEGTKQAWGFFPVWEPIIEESIDVVNRTMQAYPGRFVPFIMPPDDDGSLEGYPTVDSIELERMLNIKKGMFKGFGEIGLYGREDGSSALPPDSQRLQKIYPIIRKHKLTIYFHLGEGQDKALESVAKANPDISFVFHGDQLIDCAACSKKPDVVAGMLERNPNIYYGVDELYGNVWLLKPRSSKESFISHFKDYEPLLNKDLENWKEFIEKHPDQVIWGTDRGVSEIWDIDPDVALTLNNYTRGFIGRLNLSVQEKFAYKNAEKLIS